MTESSPVEDVFFAALELSTTGERSAYLDQACGGDTALRQRVERLLAAHPQVGSFLGGPAGIDAAQTLAPDQTSTIRAHDAAGTLIDGRYRLLEVIGEGGMGTVWLAEQLAPVRRRVAVKLVKPGMDSKGVLARFEAERQALALMDHPNIAKVFDGGTSDLGRPYFAMELVQGLAFTDYCEGRRLSIRERLALFVQICSAVQHAHQKGVIHRDLKPTNILVVEQDGVPVPRVIDFGLAKALHDPLTLDAESMHTAYGMVVGTPLYMAPEQVGANAFDVDTRADIYSLGAILYELLTGVTPLERDRFKGVPWEEIRRLIRDVEPIKPSARLSTSDCLPSLAEGRRTEPTRLPRLVAGDLDWIVLRALEKDRHRRYAPANGLALDIGRYLADEPVSAGPPSASYRMRKFVRRNRGPVLAANLLVLALIGGAAGTAWGWRRALAAEKLALIERDQKDSQRQDAETNAKIATAVKDFLQRDLLKLAAAADQAEQQETGVTVDPNLKVRELVHRAARQIEGKFSDQPLVEAEIRHTIAWTLREMGSPALAIPHQERARALYTAMLGPDAAKTLAAINNLAISYSDIGRHAEALPLREQTLKLRIAKLGAEHRDTLSSMNNLASSYSNLGRHAEALALREETLAKRKDKLGADHPDTLTSMHNLADSYSDLGRHAEALSLCETTLALRKAKLGPDHPQTLGSMTNLGAYYAELGRHKEALPLREETLEVQTAKLGPDHPITLKSMNNLANCYSALGRQGEALALREKMVKLLTAKLGPDHAETLRSMNTAAISYSKLGRRAEALALREEILKLQTAKLGAIHPDTANTTYGIACIHAFMVEKAADREKQAVLAMDWLKRAVVAGYMNVAHMKKDKDLDALRGREDFKELIKDLETKTAEKKQNSGRRGGEMEGATAQAVIRCTTRGHKSDHCGDGSDADSSTVVRQPLCVSVTHD